MTATASTRERSHQEDQADDPRHLEFILKSMARPLAALGDQLDKALAATSFTGQFAAIDGEISLDLAKLPAALVLKYERLIVRIAEAAALGECVTLKQCD